MMRKRYWKRWAKSLERQIREAECKVVEARRERDHVQAQLEGARGGRDKALADWKEVFEASGCPEDGTLLVDWLAQQRRMVQKLTTTLEADQARLQSLHTYITGRCLVDGALHNGQHLYDGMRAEVFRMREQIQQATEARDYARDARDHYKGLAETLASEAAEVDQDALEADMDTVEPQEAPPLSEPRYVVRVVAAPAGKPVLGYEVWDVEGQTRANAWLMADHEGMTRDEAWCFAQGLADRLNRKAESDVDHNHSIGGE